MFQNNFFKGKIHDAKTGEYENGNDQRVLSK